MAYRLTCSKCGRTFRDDTKSGLVDKIQAHDERQHTEKRSRSQIREEIED